MDRPTLRARLGELAFAEELADDVLDGVAALSQPVEWPLGTTIFREGAVDRQLYLIASGQVTLDMHVPGRGRVRLLSLGPGDLLAWSALLGEGRMTATAVTAESTTAIAIPAARLLELFAAQPQIGCQVMQRVSLALARRLLATRLQLLDLFSADAPIAQV